MLLVSILGYIAVASVMIMQNEYYITQILLFFSLVPVLEKLPDHQNLPLLNDMLQFWYQSRVSLFVLWIFRVNQNNFL